MPSAVESASSPATRSAPARCFPGPPPLRAPLGERVPDRGGGVARDRREPAGDAGDQRDDRGEGHRSTVDHHGEEIRRTGRRPAHHPAVEQDRGRYAEHAAGRRQHRALGDGLAHQAHATGAEGGAQRHLARSGVGLRQQEPGNVRADDEEGEERGAERRGERDTHGGRQPLLAQRQELGAPAAIGLGIERRKSRGDRAQLHARLLALDARGEPRDQIVDAQIARLAVRRRDRAVPTPRQTRGRRSRAS